MTDYLLKKDKKKWIKISNETFDGLHMKPRLKKHESLIDIQDLVIIDEELKKDYLLRQFDRQYRKMIAIMIDIIESSDTTSTDCMIALNETSKIRGMIELKLEKDLQKKEIEKLKKKIDLVEGKIKNKFLEIRTNEMLKTMMMENLTEKQGKSR